MAGYSVYETTQGTTFFITTKKANGATGGSSADVLPNGLQEDLSQLNAVDDWVDGSCATNEISFQGGQKSDIDVTSLCSSTQEVTNGLPSPAEVTLSRNWSTDDKMLKELEKAYELNEIRGFKVQFPSGMGYAFFAEVRQTSWSIATAGKVSASYTLRLHGFPQRLGWSLT
ncbi:TPA: phage tail protein [Klebsiella variicola subsp. variicola]|nr:phage tail protein [Klebsiella variicola subsp. variicola]